MSKRYIDWHNFHVTCRSLAQQIKKQCIQPESIIAIARGGLVPARIIAEYLYVNRVYSVGVKSYNDNERGDIEIYQQLPLNNLPLRDTLIVDDICDSGNTLNRVRQDIINGTKLPEDKVHTVTPYLKKDASFIPNFWNTECSASEWIVFPFESI